MVHCRQSCGGVPLRERFWHHCRDRWGAATKAASDYESLAVGYAKEDFEKQFKGGQQNDYQFRDLRTNLGLYRLVMR